MITKFVPDKIILGSDEYKYRYNHIYEVMRKFQDDERH